MNDLPVDDVLTKLLYIIRQENDVGIMLQESKSYVPEVNKMMESDEYESFQMVGEWLGS